jgi:hypothetical protein
MQAVCGGKPLLLNAPCALNCSIRHAVGHDVTDHAAKSGQGDQEDEEGATHVAMIRRKSKKFQRQGFCAKAILL